VSTNHKSSSRLASALTGGYINSKRTPNLVPTKRVNTSPTMCSTTLKVASSSSTAGNGTSGQPQSPRPFRRYLSRGHKKDIRTSDLPMEQCSNMYTPAGIFFFIVKLTVPLAYMYISLVLIRELYLQFALVRYGLETYIPFLASIVSTMQNVSKLVEVWAVIEGIFYITLCLHIRWLNYKDPLEASLNSAPMQSIEERQILWEKIMDSEEDDIISFLTGWFFDVGLETISKYDVLDYLAWSMFDGRNQEHLSRNEVKQLDAFVCDLEARIGDQLYGGDGDKEVTDEVLVIQHFNRREKEVGDEEPGEVDADESLVTRRSFHFPEHSDGQTPPGFFTNLFENYKQKYEEYRQYLEKSDFHPVQDLCHFVAEKKQQIYNAEETIKQQIYNAEETSRASLSNLRDRAYFTVIDEGSPIDKQITSLSHATQTQLSEAWNQMCEMRHETAKFISSQRKQLGQQMSSLQLILDRMRNMPTSVPSYQMADVMRRITNCHDAMEKIEFSAQRAFAKATGVSRLSRMVVKGKKEPCRYAKYSRDPLLGVTTFPLGFHLAFLAVFQGLWRVMMKMRGFRRMSVGQIAYYYHPGREEDNLFDDAATVGSGPLPIVFVHGIGVGLGYYVDLIDCLIKLNRPIFLPEIPYVTGFHNWMSPNSVLPPAAVASNLTSMLATHGFLRATFIGHSYGTTWLRLVTLCCMTVFILTH